MSSESAFSPINFPSLPNGRGDDERASIRGHAAGYAAGRKQVERELDALKETIAIETSRQNERHRTEVQLALDALERSAADFRSRQLPLLTAVDTAIASAAIELAEAIVGHELSSADDAARAALDRAVTEAGPTESSIRLNPQDIAVIEAELPTRSHLRLVPDLTLDRGDAMVDVPDGTIDARVSTSLARARAALRDEAP